MLDRVVRVICRATETEPCHICRMITYNVTVTGPLGFQVSVFGPYLRDGRLIGDFGSLQEADAFADRMGEIDAGRSYVASVPEHSPRLRWEVDDPRTDDLIDRNYVPDCGGDQSSKRCESHSEG